jgi:hypothetical protein
MAGYKAEAARRRRMLEHLSAPPALAAPMAQQA